MAGPTRHEDKMLPKYLKRISFVSYLFSLKEKKKKKKQKRHYGDGIDIQERAGRIALIFNKTLSSGGKLPEFKAWCTTISSKQIKFKPTRHSN